MNKDIDNLENLNDEDLVKYLEESDEFTEEFTETSNNDDSSSIEGKTNESNTKPLPDDRNAADEALNASNDGINKETKEKSNETDENETDDSDLIEIDGIKFTQDEIKQLAQNSVKSSKTDNTNLNDLQLLDLIKSEKLSLEDINSLIDLFKGNKKALKFLSKKAKIDDDAFSLDDEDSSDYIPNNYAKDIETIKAENIVKDLAKDKEFEITKEILNTLDQESQNILFSDMNNVARFHQDVKSGIYDTLMPSARKNWILEGKSKPLLHYYIISAQGVQANKEKEINKENDLVNKEKLRTKKREVSIPKTNPNNNSDNIFFKDINTVTDKDLEKFIKEQEEEYERLMLSKHY